MEKDCANCRFWSEMLAEAVGGGPVKAMCLAEGGPRTGEYTTGMTTCSGWKENTFGAVDDPPNYGEETRALYTTEEGPDACRAAQ